MKEKLIASIMAGAINTNTEWIVRSVLEAVATAPSDSTVRVLIRIRRLRMRKSRS
jgi:hypothetical protein